MCQAGWLLLACAWGLSVCLSGCAREEHPYAKRRIGDVSSRRVPAGALVELEGVVTYADPVYDLLFVEDSSGAIRAEARNLDTALQQNQRVRLRGSVAENAGTSFLADAKVSRLSGQGTTAPARAPFETLVAGGFQDRPVEIQGVVRAASDERGGRRGLAAAAADSDESDRERREVHQPGNHPRGRAPPGPDGRKHPRRD